MKPGSIGRDTIAAAEFTLLIELVNERRLKLLKEALENKDQLLADEAVKCKQLMDKLTHHRVLSPGPLL